MFDSKNYTVRRMYIVALHSSSVRLPMLWRGRSGVLGTPESPRGLSREYSGILCVFFFFLLVLFFLPFTGSYYVYELNVIIIITTRLGGGSGGQAPQVYIYNRI